MATKAFKMAPWRITTSSPSTMEMKCRIGRHIVKLASHCMSQAASGPESYQRNRGYRTKIRVGSAGSDAVLTDAAENAGISRGGRGKGRYM
jgi:hypothetical protein